MILEVEDVSEFVRILRTQVRPPIKPDNVEEAKEGMIARYRLGRVDLVIMKEDRSQ